MKTCYMEDGDTLEIKRDKTGGNIVVYLPGGDCRFEVNSNMLHCWPDGLYHELLAHYTPEIFVSRFGLLGLLKVWWKVKILRRPSKVIESPFELPQEEL